MNPKVEEFIIKMKDEQEKQKKEHLISLGLIDETKSVEVIEYYDVWDGTQECQWVPNKQKYRKKVQKYEALDVTDEEYQEILKYAPVQDSQISVEAKSKKQTRWSNVICATSIIMTIVCAVIGILYAWIEDSFMPIMWVAIYLAVYIPYAIGFARIVEAAEKYLQK